MDDNQSGSVMIAAIDFGTTSSGYAFSFKYEYDGDLSQIQLNSTWHSDYRDLISLKTPTCLLLKPDKTFHSFGYEAENTYADLAIDKEHEDWYYFPQFKKQMYINGVFNSSAAMVLDDTGSKTIQPKTLFSYGIDYLKNHLIEYLGRKAPEINVENIFWIFPVPATWEDKDKLFLKEAAKEAGLNINRIIISLEPEAATLYGMFPLTTKFFFRPGTRHLVLDLGGCAANVTVQEVVTYYQFKVLHASRKDGMVGNCVTEAFLQFLIHFVGDSVLQEFKSDYKEDYLELLREKEKNFRLVTNNKEGSVSLTIPTKLDQVCQKYYKQNICEKIKTKNRTTKCRGDKLRIDANVIKEFYKKATSNVIEYVEKVLEYEKCKGVNTFIVVGGFSSSHIVQNTLKKHFTNIRIIFPEESEIAVLRGAVLMGQHSETIVPKSNESNRENKSQMKELNINEVRKHLDELKEKIKEIGSQPLYKCVDTLETDITEITTENRRLRKLSEDLAKQLEHSKERYETSENKKRSLKDTVQQLSKKLEAQDKKMETDTNKQSSSSEDEEIRRALSLPLNEQKDILKLKIRKNFKYLVKNTILEELLDGFFQEGIFKQDDVDRIKSEKTVETRNRCFLEMMFKKKSAASTLFLKELEENERSDVVQKIKETTID